MLAIGWLFGLRECRGWRQDTTLRLVFVQRDGWIESGPEVSVLFVGEETEVEGHAGDSYQEVMRVRHAAGTSAEDTSDVQFRRCRSPHGQSALQ